MRGIKKNCRKFKLHKSRFTQDDARRGHYFLPSLSPSARGLLVGADSTTEMHISQIGRARSAPPEHGSHALGSLIMQAIDPKGENQD